MGMFDTIVFSKPIACATCGKLHRDTQTKQFDKAMTTYFVGDIVPTNVIHGVIEETIVCDHDSGSDSDSDSNSDSTDKISFDQKVYFVIWHGIMVSVSSSFEEAKIKLDSFGLGDLFFMYQLLYQERNDFQGKYERLRSWIKQYRKFQKLPKEKQQEIVSGDGGILDLSYFSLLSHLKKEDPFLSFLEELDEFDLSDKTLMF